MDKREVIIREFERFVQEYSVEYTNYDEEVLEGVISLLKAQEPRVMTPSEVLEAEVVYAEDIDKAEIIPVLVNGRVHDRLSLIRAHLGDSQSHVFYPTVDDYGTRWRCWNERPSDVQREETPWNG